MCMDIMEATPEDTKPGRMRRAAKPGAGLRWRLQRVSAEVKEGARKVCGAAAVRTTVRRYLRQEQQRLQAANLGSFLGVVEKKRRRKQAADQENSTGAFEACLHRHPAGAMAPENTTQYLMSNAYEDMQRDFSDPASRETNFNDISVADPEFERYLAFQQRAFEEVVSGLAW